MNTMKRQLVVGLPRAMLYHRYGTLWRTFFEELGVKVVVSPPTNKKILDDGAALAIDEACLSLKIFFGHVQALLPQCDYVLVPRIASFGRNREMCTRFFALYDLARTAFQSQQHKIIGYNVDVLRGVGTQLPLVELAVSSLGYSLKEATVAWRRAAKADKKQWKQLVREEEQRYAAPGLRILIAGHSYVEEDAFIGRPVLDFLQRAGATPIRADRVDRDEALRRSRELSPTCKWELSREILGSVAMHREKVDGVILLSAFPCAPDSMVNELLLRKLKGVPVLNLVLDGQSGAAGVETRLESFLDIIRFQKGTLV